MTIPLRPRLPGDAVARPRLLAALDRGRDRPLLLLSGPAGYGKTTLLGQWLAATPAPAAWLTLDGRDDAAAVVVHLVAALRPLAPGVGRAALGLLRLPGVAAPVDLGATLAEDLAGLAADALVVLDDYQEVADPGVHALLGALLRHPLPRLHLVLATRVDPPLPLARLRARGQLVELRAADLRLTAAEAGRFLGRALPAPRAPGEVAALAARTEGWAAGLRLTALALRDRADAAGVAAAGAVAGRGPALVLEYLLEEVLDRQPPAVQDFLLRTAVPEHLCAPLCDALVAPGAPGPPGPPAAPGGALLDAVVRAGLFVTALDAPPARAPGPGARAAAPVAGDPAAAGPWYRYHALFRELLLHQLRERLGAAAEAALHARAGAWFGAAGLVDEGVYHLLAAGDGGAAAALVEGHAHPALEAGQWPALERWLDRLPAAAARRPATAVARAWIAQRRARYGVLPGLLAAAQALLDGTPAVPPAERAALEGQLAALTAIARFADDDLAGTLAAARVALAKLPADGVHHARGGAVVYAILAATALDGMDAARDWLEAGAAGAAPARAAAWALIGVACGAVRCGRYREAAAAARALLPQGAALGIPHCTIWGHTVLGAVHYEWDELDRAAAHFGAVLAAPEPAPLLAQHEATLGLALTLQAQGRPAAADAVVDRLATALTLTANAGQLALVDAFRARLALRRGDAAAVRRWLQAGPAPGAGAGPARHWLHFVFDAPPLTRAWARLSLAPASPAPATARAAGLAELDAVLDAVRPLRTEKRRAEALALRAVALEAGGAGPAALAALAQAVDLGAAGALRRTFLDLGPPVARLLGRLAAARRPPGAYLQRLAAAAAAGGAPPASRAPGPTRAGGADGLVEPLTGRERDILAGLAQRLSNKEIAAALVVSPETVKSHVAHLSAKLGVAGRRAAVRRAAELRLLPPIPG